MKNIIVIGLVLMLSACTTTHYHPYTVVDGGVNKDGIKEACEVTETATGYILLTCN